MTRMARIKQVEDVTGLRGGEGFHDSDGVVQVTVVACLAWLKYHMTCLCTLLPFIASLLVCTGQILCTTLSAKKPLQWSLCCK